MCCRGRGTGGGLQRTVRCDQRWLTRASLLGRGLELHGHKSELDINCLVEARVLFVDIGDLKLIG